MNDAGVSVLKSVDEMWDMLITECNKRENRRPVNEPHPAAIVRDGLELQRITEMTREEAAISMLVVMTLAWNAELSK